MMDDFIDDMLHMTEGEKLVSYWPLWLTIFIVSGIAVYVMRKKK